MSAENRPERASKGGPGALLERILGGFASARAGLWRGSGRVLRERSLGLATLAVVTGAALLALSEFMDLYRIVDLHGQLVAGAKATREGSDQHSYALLVIGVTAAAAVVVARLTEQPLPALAAAGVGAIALAIVLIGDLPDVTSAGLTVGPVQQGNADPAAGFWVELVGALLTVVAALALAHLLAVERAARRAAYQR
jgi:hypothetical protein